MPRSGVVFGLTEVTPWLWLSGFPTTGTIAQGEFSLVLSVCSRRPYLPLGVRGAQIDIEDSVTVRISRYFTRAAELIDQERRQGGKVLVNCQMGVSRSVSIVLAYLMIKRKMRLQEAFRMLSAKRPQVYPNARFCQDLIQLECEIFGEASATLTFIHSPQLTRFKPSSTEFFFF